MLNIMIHWLATALLLLLVAYVMPGFIIGGFGSAMVVAIVLGLINVTIKPIIVLLTLPLNILTLGLFSLVINALMLALSAWVVPGFEIHGFWSALGGALLLAIATSLLGSIQSPKQIVH